MPSLNFKKTSAMDCCEYVHEPSGSRKCEELRVLLEGKLSASQERLSLVHAVGQMVGGSVKIIRHKTL